MPISTCLDLKTVTHGELIEGGIFVIDLHRPHARSWSSTLCFLSCGKMKTQNLSDILTGPWLPSANILETFCFVCYSVNSLSSSIPLLDWHSQCLYHYW